MRTFDLSPLLRSTVGFDRVSRLLDAAARVDDGSPSYPPYNIEKLADDRYSITMAVAGFADEDIEIVTADSSLVIKGKVSADKGERQFVHRGIAERAFERHFQLADYLRVDSAALEHGLLTVSLVREVPEALKPRSIKINKGVGSDVLQREVA
jgi:molecular chaperone IbpA